MTLPSTPRRAGPFYGDGSATQFPFSFKTYAREDVQFVVTPALGDPTAQVLDADYTVTLNLDQDNSPGGTVTYPISGSPLAVGDTAAIAGGLAYGQPTDLPDGGAYRARNVETMGDRLGMLIQQLREILDRALVFPLTDGIVPVLPSAATRAGRYLGFDANGQFTGLPIPAGSAAALALDLINAVSVSKGAALVGYNPALNYTGNTVGAALKAAAAAGFMSVTQYGTVGTADDTTVFQNALNAASASKRVLLVPTGTYTVLPLTVPSNVVLFFEPGAVVKAKTGYGVNDRMLNINGVSNVTIYGNGAQMQMLKAEYVSGEQRHAVFIINSTDVRIYDLTARDSGGDGFYIGRDTAAGTHCQRVNLIGCQAINNRRQGLSIVSCDTANIDGCTFRDTTGTPPTYGIDVEPNDSDDVIRNINITNVKTSGNSGGGIIIALQYLAATAANDVSVHVNGWLSDGDGANSPGNAPAGLRVTGNGVGAWAFPIRGIVKVSNFEIRSPKSSGIWNTYWTSSNTPFLHIEDGVIIDVASASPANDEDKCGIVIWGYNVGAQDFGNIEINRVRVRDTRGTPRTYSPVYVFKTAGATGVGQGRNIRLRDVMGEGFTPLSGRGHLLAIVDMDQSTVTYSQEQIVTDMPDDSNRTRSYAGYTIFSTSARVNTLPKASLNRGLSYRFFNSTEGAAFQIRPTTGDLLDYCDSNLNTDLVLSRFMATVEYLATESNYYRATSINDYAKRIGPQQASQLTGPALEVWVTAMPTTGLWGQGTRAWLRSPSAGAPYFWIRLTTGSGNVLNTDWKAGPNL